MQPVQYIQNTRPHNILEPFQTPLNELKGTRHQNGARPIRFHACEDFTAPRRAEKRPQNGEVKGAEFSKISP